MTDVEYNFFKAFDSLHRLKISSMLPGIPHAEYGTLHTIENVAKEKKGEVVTASELVKRLPGCSAGSVKMFKKSGREELYYKENG